MFKKTLAVLTAVLLVVGLMALQPAEASNTGPPQAELVMVMAESHTEYKCETQDPSNHDAKVKEGLAGMTAGAPDSLADYMRSTNDKVANPLRR